jgi:hypothetical protein
MQNTPHKEKEKKFRYDRNVDEEVCLDYGA